jgi:hypothetical protein
MGDFRGCFGLLGKHWGEYMGLLSYAVTLWHQLMLMSFHITKILFEANSGKHIFVLWLHGK